MNSSVKSYVGDEISIGPSPKRSGDEGELLKMRIKFSSSFVTGLERKKYSSPYLCLDLNVLFFYVNIYTHYILRLFFLKKGNCIFLIGEGKLSTIVLCTGKKMDNYQSSPILYLHILVHSYSTFEAIIRIDKK